MPTQQCACTAGCLHQSCRNHPTNQLPSVVARRYNTMYRLIFRKRTVRYYTDAELTKIDAAINTFDCLFQDIIAPFMLSKGNTIKYHRLAHVTQMIRRLGAMSHMHAQFQEMRHGILKSVYNAGHKRRRDGADMVDTTRRMRLIEMAQEADTTDLSATDRPYQTIYQLTASSGEAHLLKSGTKILWRILHETTAGSERQPSRQEKRDAKRFIKHQPELEYLPATLLAWADREDVPISSMPSALHAVKTGCIPAQVRMRPCWLQSGHLAVPCIMACCLLAAPCANTNPLQAWNTVHMEHGAMQVPWRGPMESEVQSIRAAYNFYSKNTEMPWFDCVAIKGDKGQTWYAELRLIFRVGAIPLAYVRWFKEVTNNPDILTKYGCIKLEWEMENNQPKYDVVNLSCILRREYVVPDFANDNPAHPTFHVSVFKWNSPMADKRTLAEKDADRQGHTTGPWNYDGNDEEEEEEEGPAGLDCGSSDYEDDD